MTFFLNFTGTYVIFEIKYKMVIYFDIDKFLNKNDFIICLNNNINWPWQSTHFILSEICHGCGNMNIQDVPVHFTTHMAQEDIRYLLESSFFWCQSCTFFTVYDHYPLDECYYCNN